MATKKPTIDLTSPIFTDKDKAREYFESVRWPDGPICPHCGCFDRVMQLKGKSTRPGVYKCGDCRMQFTVTVGTVMEGSHIPMNKWMLAITLMCSSKKGISAHQLHRTLGVTYKTAWFMAHRIREAMREESPSLLGGNGGAVEVDETFVGRRTRRRGEKKRKAGTADKQKVLSLVERKGRAHSYHVPTVTAKTLHPIIKKQIAKDSYVITDEASQYVQRRAFIGLERLPLQEHFDKYDFVTHSIGEYVRGDIHTNTIEGFFSILKRGIGGVYQHCSKQHLKRYLAEFDFRYTYRQKRGFDDHDRTIQAIKGTEGKRLTYLPTHQRQGVPVPSGL